MEWRDLTPNQRKALAGIGKMGRASAYELRVSIATLCALERRKLIRVETTLGSIAFPRNAKAELRDDGRKMLAAHG